MSPIPQQVLAALQDPSLHGLPQPPGRGAFQSRDSRPSTVEQWVRFANYRFNTTFPKPLQGTVVTIHVKDKYARFVPGARVVDCRRMYTYNGDMRNGFAWLLILCQTWVRWRMLIFEKRQWYDGKRSEVHRRCSNEVAVGFD